MEVTCADSAWPATHDRGLRSGILRAGLEFTAREHFPIEQLRMSLRQVQQNETELG